jgi:hypothetical protein
MILGVGGAWRCGHRRYSSAVNWDLLQEGLALCSQQPGFPNMSFGLHNVPWYVEACEIGDGPKHSIMLMSK